MLLEPVQSVVNFSFYRQVAQKSLGRAIGYLSYLTLLFSIVSTIGLYIRLNPILQDTIAWAATSVPPITFANGKASSALTAPLLIRHPRFNMIGVMIDTNRVTPVAADEMQKQQIMAYLTQNALYLATNSDKIEQYDLLKASSQGTNVINGDFFRKVGSILSTFIYPIAWVTTIVLFFLWKMLAGLVYSLLGLAINAIASANLDFESLFKIAIYAQTPVIFLQTLQVFLPRQIPGFIIIGFLIVGIYTWQAIKQQGTEAEV